ncbi:DUF5060 domain-containing protein [Mariniflexile litorale]|uniref:DUF5060 domain-containing protein n=1 Tax=Mariniflexile litorale TaxID=3045158 RepID=A0AAU7EH36_9FLAO|nr:DUF5060 domain-containing protein [Mariniflexile sp. KMM 9835]MDQ8211745.1 DUF5060 domain-containing protein [Mariniflexile sp. KMM 9835]
MMSKKHKTLLLIIITSISFANAQSVTNVGLYKTFERSIINNNSYSNKFTDVDLTCTYISPSGKTINFYGFFDGDGLGGGDTLTGNVWKIRFLPEEAGKWKYKWKWSDATPGGEGTFFCDSKNAGKGVLRAYNENPRWFAYNGTEPVFLKSYYDSSMRPFAQPWDCVQNYYQTFIDNGYNHLQVNWLLPSVTGIDIADCSPPSLTKAIYEEKGKASSTMNLDVWNKMEVLLSWLNDKNVNLFMFLGFDGGRNGKPQAWASLSEKEQDFLVRYVVARIAPYSNIMWNYVWEVEGNTENGELGCMRLVQKYDVFNHLRTYEDEKPNSHEWNRPEYTFAGTENHRIHSDNREPEFWAAPWTHHEACLMSYVQGKPVYMVEGNALWRHYWAATLIRKSNHILTQSDVRQSAWGCATAASSFTWCGHTSLSFKGSEGIPFFDGQDNPYRSASKSIDILNHIMNNEVVFHRMTPQDSLLSGNNKHDVWCLAEPGQQYLVFSTNDQPFKLKLSKGKYNNNKWVNSMTGESINVPALTASKDEIVPFTQPNPTIDWVLLIRKD